MFSKKEIGLQLLGFVTFLSPFGISTIIASLNAFGICPVDINTLNMLVICSIMFGVTCWKICSLIYLQLELFSS